MPVSATRGDLLAVLLSTAGLNRTSFDGRVAVVGNGPLFNEDRLSIDKHDIVIRFNDVNYMNYGEKITLHVVREPTSVAPKIQIQASIWSISPVESFVGMESALSTPVYERQYGKDNWASPDAAIFPSCGACASCAQSGSFAGPSTGAVALSELNELDEIKTIDVYGMNWNGPPKVHIDFANNTLVHDCCQKCVFNHTSSDYYGTGLTVIGLVLVAFGGAALLSLLAGTCVEAVAPHQKQKEFLPLLAMHLDVESEKDGPAPEPLDAR
jgi:hypothetical protein